MSLFVINPKARMVGLNKKKRPITDSVEQGMKMVANEDCALHYVRYYIGHNFIDVKIRNKPKLKAGDSFTLQEIDWEAA